MGLIITLPDADFSGQGFPTLASFGQFPASGSLRLFKVLSDANKYADSSTNALAATLETNATLPPTYSNGAINFPDTSGVTQYSRLLTGITPPTAYTAVMLVRQKAARLMYLLRNANGQGSNCYMGTGGTFEYQFGNGTNRNAQLGSFTTAINTWVFLAIAVDATGLYGSKNGSGWTNTLFANLGGVPTTPGDQLTFGSNQAAFSAYADLAMFGLWNRVLTADEISGIYRATKNVCRVSKTSIVLP